MRATGAIDSPGLFILFLIFQFGSAFLLTPLEVVTTRTSPFPSRCIKTLMSAAPQASRSNETLNPPTPSPRKTTAAPYRTA